MVTAQDDFVSENWFLDTGCSDHMTGHKDWLTNLDTSKQSKMRLANDSTITTTSEGDIVIRRNGSNNQEFSIRYWHER
ncbi:hypothetical protein VIGAN_01385500 [Vigna angularis var. angularis]|uniref:Retrovirus-related Pol polyprotein from transposon TNT 1-94-like beta-barrel domain-containing protein n=1 Tax=Vigna angularis var. angularis TaxID=157739 RepID=A0A0S3R5S0_PHAAN|nr:hypothetical protein VIGAN_01385500 [Vigna angularis var. angularis]